MARKIETRWKIAGTLTAETPLHVGGIGGDADTDLALAVNGSGEYYIPGTSLAGAFRAWMGRSQDEASIDDLWGFQKDDKGHASFIIIDDAEVTLPNGMSIEIREGVGIDRHTGAAAERFKYSRAILPKGVSFPVTITLDAQSQQTPDHIWQLLLALEKGDIRIGAAKTRGLGKVKLRQPRIQKHELNHADGVFDSLLNQNLRQQWPTIKQDVEARLGRYQSPQKLSLEIEWNPKDPVMVKTEGDGIAVDILPLVSQIEAGVRFVIPGSSIKGVLRAHAERIVRTLLEIDITPDKEGKPKFNDQIRLVKEGQKAIELINAIFGAAEKSKTKQSQGKIGTLSIDDCYAQIPMTVDDWANVEHAPKSKDDEFQDFKKTLGKAISLEEGNDNPFRILQPAMHVAVDRWTGGAAEGMLYSVLEPIGVDWERIGLQLDLAKLEQYSSALVKPAIALLFLVLRDFSNRKIPIGYGTNRGMGTVEVTQMQLSCSSINGLDGIEDVQELAFDLSSLGPDLLDHLTTKWTAWIENHSTQEEIAG